MNWCPALGTVLANEEVDRRRERSAAGIRSCGIPLRQWMLRITAYADRLEKDLEQVDWPESIKKLQRNWIGRSTGAEVDFFIGAELNAGGKPTPAEFEAWKSAPYEERLSGQAGGRRAAHLHDAARHALRRDLHGHRAGASARRAADDARQCAAGERLLRARRRARAISIAPSWPRNKTGVFTGSFAINPVNGEPMPIWIADYVLASYGTGAIMAVPAHDERDFEFAQAVRAADRAGRRSGRNSDRSSARRCLPATSAFTADGIAINSGTYNGLADAEVQGEDHRRSGASGLGRAAVNYKLRDWLFSRQHFWGEPFPILHELDADGKPTGRLRTVPAERVAGRSAGAGRFQAARPARAAAGKSAGRVALCRRSTAGATSARRTRCRNGPARAGTTCGSSIRKNDQALVDPELEKAWMPVDLYIGGAEHAVLHLLYARFWHKVLLRSRACQHARAVSASWSTRG